MEMSSKLYETMMTVPTDKNLLLGQEEALPLMTGTAYDPKNPASWVPPPIYEWSKSSCGRNRDCVMFKITAETVRLNKIRVGER
jgi:hypothetical protein